MPGTGSRLSRSSSLTVALSILLPMSAHLEEVPADECDAMISIASFGGTEGHLQIDFEIEVVDCERCSGAFEYTLVLYDTAEDRTRTWERSGSWTWTDSDTPFLTTEYRNVASSEILMDVTEVEVTACTCLN